MNDPSDGPQALLLDPNRDPELIPLPVGYEALRRAVTGNDTGYIEAIDPGLGPEVTAYGDEEAKLVQVAHKACAGKGCDECDHGVVQGLDLNPLASRIVYGDPETAADRRQHSLEAMKAAGVNVIDASTGDPREPYIAGPLLLTGFDPRSGENRGIDQQTVARVMWLHEHWQGRAVGTP